MNHGSLSPALKGGLLALLAAVLFGLSTPMVQSLGKGVDSFSTAALLYAGAAVVAWVLRQPAAKEAGAVAATWDTDSKKLKVSFDANVTSISKIQEKVAGVGHDNAGFKASDEVYNKLHGCCKYIRYYWFRKRCIGKFFKCDQCAA